MIPQSQISHLQSKSNTIRSKIFDVLSRNAPAQAHIGGALSSVEILVTLFYKIMRYKGIKFTETLQEDKFLLSKGHCCLTYYAILNDLGLMSDEQLYSYGDSDPSVFGHPVRNPETGIEFSTGSLGMGLSMAVGLALGKKLNGLNSKVFTLIGDGECNEGVVWEAAACAAQYQLGNLIVILDRNHLQQTGKTQDICNLDLERLWNAFKWNVDTIDGHCIGSLTKALQTDSENTPKILIADTVKGKGVPVMEGDNKWHHNAITKNSIADIGKHFDQ